MGYNVSAYAYPSILAVVVSIGLAVFIYVKNQTSRTNRLYSLLLAAFSIFAVGQMALIMSTDPGSALIWARIKFLGLIFVAPIFLHAILMAVDKKNPVYKKIIYLYAPSLIFTLAIPTRLSITGVRSLRHGFDMVLGPIGFVTLLFILVYTIYAAYVMMMKYNESMELERRRTTPLLIGSIFFLVGVMWEFGRLMATSKGIGSGNVYPFLPIAGTVMGVLLSYSIVKYTAVQVKPVLEAGKVKAPKPKVEPGMLILTRGLDKSREAFLGLVSNGCQGLIVTKNKSADVRTETGLERVPIVEFAAGERKDTVSPKKPENLFLTLQEFINGQGNSAILVEDLNYLLSANSVETIRSFLINAVELVSDKGGRLIVALDEEKMNEHVLSELDHLVKYQYLMPVFTCLSNPLRKDVLYFLEAGKATFTEIFKEVGVIFPSKVSFHLNSLKDAGLLEQDEERKYFLTWKGTTALEMIKEMEGMLTEKFQPE